MVGQTISHYRIIEKLGAGGMGEVYLAEDERLGRKLAIKFLPEQFTREPDRLRRFEQEARAASALNHPNIITIYEIGEEGGRLFIATELIEGETLRQRMSAGGVGLIEALEIVIQAASALQAAHAAGIVHRDIKPENIMIRPDGYLKVLDFGLAKLTERTSELSARTVDQNDPTRSLFETQPGFVIGTVAYMSPEQARGQRMDGRTDIFSLGIVLYELVSGQRPFVGGTTSDMIASLLMGEPQRLSQHLPGAPVELERLVDRMLAKDRDSRCRTAQEVVVELKRVTARLQVTGETGGTLLLEDETALLDAGKTKASNRQAPSLTYATNLIQPAGSPASYVANVTPTAPVAASIGSGEGLQARSQPRARRVLLPALVVMAVALTAGILALQASRRNAVIDSIAVLPFVNENDDLDTEYVSEGVAEGIINTLSQLPELSVASRNSVIRYRGQEVDAQVVGRELGVKAVLLGRVQRRGENLTINSELVDARTGRQIWGERFTRKLNDLMAVQEEITRNLAGKLRWRLTDAQQESLADYGTSDAAAYDLYLKGRYYFHQGTPEAMRKADEYFEAAAGKDPGYASATAGCAACHAAGADGVAPQESMEKAKFVALKALKADPSLVDARLTLAQINLRYDWDFKTAEGEFKRAIELDPKHATARLRYAEFLALMGRNQEARVMLDRALALDPNSPSINQAFGTLAYYQGNYSDAVERLLRTLRIDDDFAPAHTGLGLAYEQKGQTQDAVMEFLRARLLARDNQERLTALKQAFATGGREAFWQTYLSQLTAESQQRYIPSTAIAAVHTRLGENEKAFAALDKAMAEKDGGLVELKVEPVFEPLRAQTKFSELLRRVGLQ